MAQRVVLKSHGELASALRAAKVGNLKEMQSQHAILAAAIQKKALGLQEC